MKTGNKLKKLLFWGLREIMSQVFQAETGLIISRWLIYFFRFEFAELFIRIDPDFGTIKFLERLLFCDQYLALR